GDAGTAAADLLSDGSQSTHLVVVAIMETPGTLRHALNGGLALIRGQRCLVTGGAGTIGSTIVDQLVADGAGEVIVLDNLVRGRRENLTQALASGHVRLEEGDIRDRALVRRLMEGIDLVFHQAAIRITQCASEPRLALEVLVDGTYEVV